MLCMSSDSTRCASFFFAVVSSILVASRGVARPVGNRGGRETMKNARTVNAHVAKSSIDRSAELTADVPFLYFFNQKKTTGTQHPFPLADSIPGGNIPHQLSNVGT